ncbi:hypothetical protein SRHO_G00238170 [Serrasalmus rhombeus]
MQCDTVYAEVENCSAATLPIGQETISTVYSFVEKKPQPPSNITHNKPETIYATVSQHSNTVIQAELDEVTSDVRN